jgi:hypothetical protein
MDPYGACDPAGDACGLDGECDGAGACRYPDAETVCAPATCESGELTDEAYCSGDGGCDLPSSTSCGMYACAGSGTACRTNCSNSNSGHCAPDAWCSGTSCVARKEEGEACSSDEECVSESCGGLCCPTSELCNCPQPDEDNLLANPGFDQNVTAGWDMVGTGVTWVDEDATVIGSGPQCPVSGSARISNTEGQIYQCVPIQPDTSYNFGAQIRTSNDGEGVCTVVVFALADCGNTGAVGLGGSVTQFDVTTWTDYVTNSFSNTGTMYTAAEIRCRVTAGTVTFDRIFLSPVPVEF